MGKWEQLHVVPHVQDYRYSNDSGQGTERASSSLRSPSLCLMEATEGLRSIEGRRSMDGDGNHDMSAGMVEKQMNMHETGGCRSWRMSRRLSERLMHLTSLTNDVLDRVILLLGFIAITTGIVTYGAFFVWDLSLERIVYICSLLDSVETKSSVVLHTL